MIFDVELPLVVRGKGQATGCSHTVRVEAINAKDAASILGRSLFGSGTFWRDADNVLHEGNDGSALSLGGIR